jgi:hypothetical protein
VIAGGPHHVIFTGNSDTPYMGTTVDLRQTGPVVIELPPDHISASSTITTTTGSLTSDFLAKTRVKAANT